MSDNPTEQIKKFVFSSNCKKEVLEIFIPELLQGSYSFYTWPSAPVLAWFLWENRENLPGHRVLELGSGTALPGILAAKCGAQVTLSDSATLPKSLAHTKRSCHINNLTLNENIRVIGLTWGLFLSNLDSLGPLDLIIGSDCFFEPVTFEDIIVTVAYLLSNNSGARFVCTYQERSSDWSIEHLLEKWGLTCKVHNISNLGTASGIDIHEIIGGHTIHLLEITCKA
ncbi:histone-arginine methyltransferase METTL23 [Euwallacea similis]|uniref:histone-arginine methyltransferase METTL23 n=1 Tax=Euwallacea similis TaxID=1736056 RepID=UPI00344C5AEC